jgi:TatD DNase family protein
MRPVFFDSHCHFDFAEFDAQREQLWSDCVRSDIRGLLIPGIAPEQWLKAHDIALSHQGIVMAAGLHPWWLASATLPQEDTWLAMLEQKHCVAIGECGLDGGIAVPISAQKVVFEQHLQMAVEYSMPLIIHARQAHNEIIHLLIQYRPPKGGVIHGFTGSYELAMTYWRMGFYLGIGGSITYPRAQKTREMAKKMPLESLLLETDAPDMPLFGHQGQVNHPIQLLSIANTLANIRGESVLQIAQMTTKNSQYLFND